MSNSFLPVGQGKEKVGSQPFVIWLLLTQLQTTRVVMVTGSSGVRKTKHEVCCISAPSLQFTHSTAQLVPSARAHSEHPRYAAVLCPLLLHRVSSFYLIAYSQLTTQPREPLFHTHSVFHRMWLSMVIPIGSICSTIISLIAASLITAIISAAIHIFPMLLSHLTCLCLLCIVHSSVCTIFILFLLLLPVFSLL